MSLASKLGKCVEWTPELTRPQAKEKNEHSQQITNELVLDGGFPLPKSPSQDGFIVPNINTYGYSFRSPFYFIDLVLSFNG